MRSNVTQEELLVLLTYKEGKLFWKTRGDNYFKSKRSARIWNSRYAGKEAFTYCSDGYKAGRVFDKGYQAHRVIFCMAYGYWPSEIDHIDGDRANNRIENLREATSSQNSKNTKMPKNNKSGVVGVYFESYTNMWCASVQSENKHQKKRFRSKEDAISWRKQKELELQFHPNHGRA